MKKICAATMAVMVLFLMAACGGGPIIPAIDTDKAWGTPTYAYERSEYVVEIFSRVNGTDADGNAVRTDGDILATGSFIQSLSASGEGTQNQATVNSEFEVQWKDDVRAGEHSGLRDEITSRVIFSTGDCTPVSSEKTANLASRGGQNESYHISIDYNTLAVSAQVGKTVDGSGYQNQKDFQLKSGLMYDNEQLFYLVRAFSALTAEKAQVGFSLANGRDLYKKSLKTKTPAAASMIAGVAATTEVTLGDFILDYTEAEDMDAADSEKAINVSCNVVQVFLNEQNSGPAHRFIITNAAQTFKHSDKTTSKLVVGYDYYVFDEDGYDQFRINYRMVDYTTER